MSPSTDGDPLDADPAKAVHHAEFNDPRLVEVYDALCRWSRGDDFFMSIVNERTAARVLDLGCGTGRLALGLAAAGHAVTGVDPAGASLDAARARPGAERVTWIEGTSRALEDASFDVAVMTSHVAQFFVDDAEWSDALRDVHRALAPGGTVVFDTRDPNAREWELWNPIDSRCRIALSGDQAVEVWTEVIAIEHHAVSFRHHYTFPGGEELTSTATLRFRTELEIRQSLDDAGFAIDRMFGGWQREPVGAGDGELLVIARPR